MRRFRVERGGSITTPLLGDKEECVRDDRFNRRVCFGRVDVRAESATGEYVAHEISRREKVDFEP